jgi:hypothetical protein
MTERFLIDLMGELDFGLLEDQYMERDLLNQKQAVRKKSWFHKRAFRKGTEFAVTDSLRTAVFEQRELIDTIVAHPNMEGTLADKLDVKVDAVKKKVNWLIAIISAIVSIIVLAVSVILVIIKKKSIAKLFGKRVQTAS